MAAPSESTGTDTNLLSTSSDIYNESNDVEMGTKEASQILAIDKASVHRICSGQVVLTLATAVKELLENSIDAGATNIEIKLKEYGSESIEVTDNGSGVEQKDFEGLTLKHHTSKLQDFDDLVNVTSFGFRGEALSSLCALSNMVITTRHLTAAVGTRLEFDQNGKIVSRKSAPRQVGTTVLVQNIFYSLPVRHKEFHRNLKKEYAKLVCVLNAYCLISTNVRISCTTQTAKGSRSIVVATNGNESLRDNIANVFSPKQLLSLIEFHQADAGEDVCADFGIKSTSFVRFRISGFISKCEHGQGRSSSDRQFIFINRRPCDHAKVLKVINEVYHSFNRHQFPFVALSIEVDKESVDVNVTPDKRQIFMEGENLLLATLKTSLVKMFEPTMSVYKINNSVLSGLKSDINSLSPKCQLQQGQSEDSLNQSGGSLSQALSKLKRSFSSAFARNDSVCSSEDQLKSPVASCKKSNSFPVGPNLGSITQFLTRVSPKKSSLSTSCSPPPPTSVDHLQDKISQSVGETMGSEQTSDNSVCDGVLISGHQIQLLHTSDRHLADLAGNGTCDINQAHLISANSLSLTLGNTSPVMSKVYCNLSGQDGCLLLAHGVAPSDHVSANSTMKYMPDSARTPVYLQKKSVFETTTPPSQQMPTRVLPHVSSEIQEDTSIEQCDVVQEESRNGECFITDLDLIEETGYELTRKERVIPFSFSVLKKRLELKNSSEETTTQCFRNFRAKICPTDNKSAEDELQKEISKDMFEEMDIIGQFNLGFIITCLGRDLFIVDQHATDEKFNFEMLQRDTVMQSQKLIAPQCLELTASNETILVDNFEIFKKNGFDFLLEPDAAPTQRVKLISAPVSKNWSFGKSDIEELLFMLSDAPNVMCWPSRVRMMFASRACRKSVMIGTALNRYEMKRLVCHMGQIQQPWNCPHGRPTMRHLFNLDMLPS